MDVTGLAAATPLSVPSPGSRVVIRDEEWLVLRTDPTSDGDSSSRVTACRTWSAAGG